MKIKFRKAANRFQELRKDITIEKKVLKLEHSLGQSAQKEMAIMLQQ